MIAGCLGLLLISFASQFLTTQSGKSLASAIPLFGYFYVFAFGWLSLLLCRSLSAASLAVVRTVQFGAVAAFVATLLGLPEILRPMLHLDIALWTIVFTVMISSQTVRPWRIFSNQVMDYLGERSHSLYLTHPFNRTVRSVCTLDV